MPSEMHSPAVSRLSMLEWSPKNVTTTATSSQPSRSVGRQRQRIAEASRERRLGAVPGALDVVAKPKLTVPDRIALLTCSAAVVEAAYWMTRSPFREWDRIFSLVHRAPRRTTASGDRMAPSREGCGRRRALHVHPRPVSGSSRSSTSIQCADSLWPSRSSRSSPRARTPRSPRRRRPRWTGGSPAAGRTRSSRVAGRIGPARGRSGSRDCPDSLTGKEPPSSDASRSGSTSGAFR